jgi:PAS domain S-box-containing protein
MKIKTLLTLVISFSLMMLFFLGLWIFSISNHYNETKYHAEIAKKVNTEIFRISALSSDYLLYFQPRAARQWESTHRQLGRILDDSGIKPLSKLLDLESLRKMHSNSLNLFERLIIARSEEIRDKTILAEKQRKALSAQLLSTSQRMSLVATKFAAEIEVERSKLEAQLFWMVILTFTIFIFTLLVSWVLMAYRIVIPLTRLKKHISKVDLEHLDIKYLFSRNDEIGELINAFNVMAENIFNTSVSKKKLINEIKERKKSEKELKNQTDLTRAVLEGSRNVVVLMDAEGRVIKFNRAAENITGFSRHELLNKPIWDYVIPEEQQANIKKVFEALRNGNASIAAHYENHWVTKNGDYRLFEWSNDVIRNAENEITHIVGIGHDITDKRAAEIESQRIARELNQSRKMEALGKITGGIAHDFNNMLAIIIGYTELALKQLANENKPSVVDNLKQVQIASDRAKSLVAKMLAFTRIDQVASYPVQLNPLLKENIKLMMSILPSTIKLEVAVEKNIPDIMMDPVQLQQIIMNLILNAKDAMDDVGVIKISLDYIHAKGQECSSCHKKIEGDWVELSISDNGKGMSDEVKERVFEPFFTTKELGQGTGMGLSVLHGIVKANAGHIVIDSIRGKGTHFQILFPPVVADGKNSHKPLVEDEHNVNGDGQRILIIDDQEPIADVLYELLTSQGYECTKKYNSQEALDFYLSDINSFDLIITDHTMPDLTGLELIEAIRQRGLDIPVVIMTGYSDKIKNSKLDIKNVTLMFKPVNSKVLLSHVAKVLTSQES